MKCLSLIVRVGRREMEMLVYANILDIEAQLISSGIKTMINKAHRICYIPNL